MCRGQFSCQTPLNTALDVPRSKFYFQSAYILVCINGLVKKNKVPGMDIRIIEKTERITANFTLSTVIRCTVYYSFLRYRLSGLHFFVYFELCKQVYKSRCCANFSRRYITAGYRARRTRRFIYTPMIIYYYYTYADCEILLTVSRPQSNDSQRRPYRSFVGFFNFDGGILLKGVLRTRFHTVILFVIVHKLWQ